MKSYRASILWFAPHSEGAACARFEEDGLLVVGANAAGVQVVQAVGPSWWQPRQLFWLLPPEKSLP